MIKIHQNFIRLIEACGFALLIVAAGLYWQGPGLLLRAGFAAALYLVSRDVLAGALITRGERRLSNPDRWLYAYYLALFFGVLVALATWQGTAASAARLGGVVLGAAIYGLSMSFAFESNDHRYQHHFNTEKRRSTRLVYSWPFITLGVVAVLLAGNAAAGDVFYTLILFGFFIPHYQRVAKGWVLWANFPRLVGFGVLLAIFTWSRLAG